MTPEQTRAVDQALAKRTGGKSLKEMSIEELARVLRDMQEETRVICEESEHAYVQARQWLMRRLVGGLKEGSG